MVDRQKDDGKNGEYGAKRVAELESHFRKKKDSEKKSLTIVERLLAGSVAEEFLLDAAKFLNAEYYNDAVVERSIVRLCGYPLCSNPLKDMPKQQFHISMKTNKVYDITERKNYCCGWCFQASTHYKNQIPTSHLWGREKETIPTIKLLQKTEKCKTSHNVRLETGMISRDEVSLLERDEVVPLSTNDNVDERPCDDDSLVSGTEEKRKPVSKGKKTVSIDESKNEVAAQKFDKDCSKLGSKVEEPITDSKKSVLKDASKNDMVTRTVEKNDSKVESAIQEPVLDGKTLDTSEQSSVCDRLAALSVGNDVKNGRNKNDAMNPASERSTSRSVDDVSSRHVEADEHAPQKEVTERLLDSVLIRLSEYMAPSTRKFFASPDDGAHACSGEDAIVPPEKENIDLSSIMIVGKNLDPDGSPSLGKMPDFSQLQKDAKLQELKVQEFYGGTFKYPTQVGGDEGAESNVNKEELGDKGTESTASHIVPPIDSQSQKTIRKRIFQERVYKCFPDMLPSLGLSVQDISSELRLMLSTFHLTSQNIVLKPKQWKLMSALLVMLLAKKNEHIKQTLLSPNAEGYLFAMFAGVGYRLDHVYNELDVILTWPICD